MPRTPEPSEGPWRLREDGDHYELIDADESRICYIPASRYLDGRRDPTQEANARLIVDAVNAALVVLAARGS